jgi:hypothetical protein
MHLGFDFLIFELDEFVVGVSSTVEVGEDFQCFLLSSVIKQPSGLSGKNTMPKPRMIAGTEQRVRWSTDGIPPTHSLICKPQGIRKEATPLI